MNILFGILVLFSFILIVANGSILIGFPIKTWYKKSEFWFSLFAFAYLTWAEWYFQNLING